MARFHRPKPQASRQDLLTDKEEILDLLRKADSDDSRVADVQSYFDRMSYITEGHARLLRALRIVCSTCGGEGQVYPDGVRGDPRLETVCVTCQGRGQRTRSPGPSMDIPF